MLSDRLAKSGEVNINKVMLDQVPAKRFSTPQVYSPLPIKNPAYVKNPKNIPSFPLDEIYNPSEEPQKKQLKLNKVLLHKFNDLNLENLHQMRLESYLNIDLNRKSGGDQKNLFNEKMELMMDCDDDGTLGLIRPPSRVSNPQVFDEEFLKMNNYELVFESRNKFGLLSNSQKSQPLAEQIA